MKKIILLGIVIVVLLVLWGFLSRNNSVIAPTTSQKPQQVISENAEEVPQLSVIAENLDTPWALAFLPDNTLLVTERAGHVKRINPDGTINDVATLASVREIGEGGLLGIAAHPDFTTNHYVYFYYTFSNSGDNTLNRVVRMTYENNTLGNETVIVDNIPGASNHNGGRIKFGPDNLLYIGTGDAQEPSQAQNKNTLGGKILRITDSGKVAPNNPFKTLVYSYGHRNVQGLAWSTTSKLWATEHGRSGVLSGLDELNLIVAGNNYGWPDIEGNETRSGMQTPKQNSGNTTWAPSGASFVGNSLFFSGLRGQALYEAVINGDSVIEVKEHFKGELGRVREVITGPDGMLYITTSNKDGRGSVNAGDDKVIKVNPQKL